MLKKCYLKTCKNKFKPKTYNQKYCCIECQRIAMNERNKKNSKIKYEEEKRKRYPEFKCPHCNYLFKLDFNPIHNWKELKNIICPKCKRHV